MSSLRSSRRYPITLRFSLARSRALSSMTSIPRMSSSWTEKERNPSSGDQTLWHWRGGSRSIASARSGKRTSSVGDLIDGSALPIRGGADGGALRRHAAPASPGDPGRLPKWCGPDRAGEEEGARSWGRGEDVRADEERHPALPGSREGRGWLLH